MPLSLETPIALRAAFDVGKFSGSAPVRFPSSAACGRLFPLRDAAERVGGGDHRDAVGPHGVDRRRSGSSCRRTRRARARRSGACRRWLGDGGSSFIIRMSTRSAPCWRRGTRSRSGGRRSARSGGSSGHPLVVGGAVAVLVDVDAVRRPGWLAVEADPERHGWGARRRAHHEVHVTSVELIRDRPAGCRKSSTGTEPISQSPESAHCCGATRPAPSRRGARPGRRGRPCSSAGHGGAAAFSPRSAVIATVAPPPSATPNPLRDGYPRRCCRRHRQWPVSGETDVRCESASERGSVTIGAASNSVLTMSLSPSSSGERRARYLEVALIRRPLDTCRCRAIVG